MTVDILIKARFTGEEAKELEAYAVKTGAGIIGNFLLEALSFDLENNDGGTLDLSKAWVHATPNHFEDNEGGSQLLEYSAMLGFSDDAEKIVGDFLEQNGDLTPNEWLGKAIKSYRSFIDSRKEAGSQFYLPPKEEFRIH